MQDSTLLYATKVIPLGRSRAIVVDRVVSTSVKEKLLLVPKRETVIIEGKLQLGTRGYNSEKEIDGFVPHFLILITHILKFSIQN